MQRSASEQRVNRNLAILGFNLEILDRPPVEPDPEVVDELLMPMTSSSAIRIRPPAPPTTSLSKGKKRKSAQSIQTPSASPRHQPVPVASTSNHRFTRDEKAYQEFRSRSQRDAERRVKDQVEERERYKRKHFSLSSRANPEPTVSSPRQARLNRRSLGKERAHEEEEEEKEPERKSRKSEKDERIHYDDGRIFRNGQLVRQVGNGTQRRDEDAEEVEVKREESLEESDFDCLIVKAEEEEGSERRSSTENEEGEEREQFALKQLGLEKQRLLRHSPLVLPFQPTPHQVLPTPHPRPRTQSQSDSLPSLASFLTSLDLPRLSRLIPHFHSIGVETSDELFALSSQTAVGKKRRENVMGMVEELERGLGREFKRFERETVEGELEERRKEWVVSE